MDARSQSSQDEQTALWNGSAGRGWVEAQSIIDEMFAPLERMLVEAVGTDPSCRVLDVGSGTGGTTLAIARSLGATAHCVGLDLSEPMTEAARARAERAGSSARFVCANAQTHGFAPASFDVVVSRFGVMFFDDPVRAFANLRHAASPRARLAFLAWRGPEQNPFMTAAERAAQPLLPNLPTRAPDAPGQFGFADQARVQRILEQSGWLDLEIRAVDVVCSFAEAELDRYLTRLGVLARVLQELAEPLRTQVIDTVRAAFEPYVHGAEVRYTAACWMVRARAPA